jgi:hypothetical protein
MVLKYHPQSSLLGSVNIGRNQDKAGNLEDQMKPEQDWQVVQFGVLPNLDEF